MFLFLPLLAFVLHPLLSPFVSFAHTAAASPSSASAALSSPEYHEQLLLRPLPHGSLLASFDFRSNTTLSGFEAHNFRYFPRSLGQILQHAGTRELHLRFSLGRWDAESWGARPWNGTREGGTGVELWAWLEAGSNEEADKKWLILTNALSGLFCASLNFIDSTRTTRPVMSFRPEGLHPRASPVDELYLLHGVLPREVVCTENLTPFLKLLPCKGKAGISSLLDGHKLFDASWQSMAIDVRPLCPPEGQGGIEECVLQIEQTIDMVLDIERSKRPRDNPIPRPPAWHELRCDTSRPYHGDDACFPLDYEGQDWSLSQIFGKTMKGLCPLTDPTAIAPVCIDVPHDREVYTSGFVTEVKSEAAQSRCFELRDEAAEGKKEFELVLPRVQRAQDYSGGEQQQHQEQAQEGVDEHGNPVPTTPPSPSRAKTEADELVPPIRPPLYAERSFTGHGQERGGVQTILTNPRRDAPVEFVVMESLPWFMRVYLHTLRARVEPANPAAVVVAAANSTSTTTPPPQAGGEDVIQAIHYRPALDRSRGTQLEVRVRLPPASTAFLSYDFEKTVLRYTEYPPDANRGFDVAAAVITILGDDGETMNLRTTTLLLSLPTPDFSMPYNVIIFTSTAIALAFGGLFNIIVRRFVAADEGPEINIRALRLRLQAGLARALAKVKQRMAAKGTAEVAADTKEGGKEKVG